MLALDEEMAALDELLTGLVTATAPQLLDLCGVGIDTAVICWSRQATTPNGCVTKLRGRTSAVLRRSRRPRARPCGTASTAAVTVKPTMRCGASSSLA